MAERTRRCDFAVDAVDVKFDELDIQFHVVEFVVVCSVGQSFAIHAAANDFDAG